MRGDTAKPQTIDAVLFDLDGLLVDSEPVWFRVRTEIFERVGMKWTEADQKELMGKSTGAWIEYLGKKLEGKLTRDEVVGQTLDGMVGAYRNGGVRVMPGAQEAVRYCKGQFEMALASGSPRILIEAALEVNGWQKTFRVVLSSDEVPRGKPAPDVYLEAAKRLGVDPKRCVVVEDSGSGILAGKAAGAAVIAVPNQELMPPKEALDKADVRLDSLEEFEGALKQLSGRE